MARSEPAPRAGRRSAHGGVSDPRGPAASCATFRLASPAAKYIAFLILDGLTDCEVHALLNELALDPGDSGFVKRTRSDIVTPRAFKPRSHTHVGSRAFVEKLGLTEMFDDTLDAKRAVALLKAPRARELVETLSISGAPHQAIARALAGRVPDVTLEAVALFRSMFFDLAPFTRGDLRLLLDLRAERDAAAALQQSPAAAAAVRRRHRYDPRVIAVGLPEGAPFAHVALLAIGVDVPVSEPAVLLRRIRDRAVLRAAERLHGRSRRDAQTCVTLLELGLRATELIERVQDPQVGLITQLQRIELRSTDAKVPTLHELAGKDGFTVDLAPTDLHETPDERLERSR